MDSNDVISASMPFRRYSRIFFSRLRSDIKSNGLIQVNDNHGGFPQSRINNLSDQPIWYSHASAYQTYLFLDQQTSDPTFDALLMTDYCYGTEQRVT